MADAAIQAIKGQSAERLNFTWFRQSFMDNHEMRDALNYGHAVLGSVPELEQYLHTYGPMIESQWENVADLLETIDPPRRVIDYGCGQGLAGLLVNDVTDGRLLSEVQEVVLIEPSLAALARAEAIYEKLVPNARVAALGKRFDDVVKADIPTQSGPPTLHVFSNSLDVLGYEPLKLFEKTLHSGRNTVISVSHDRSFNGGTPKIERVKAAFEHPEMTSHLKIIRSTLDRFTCTNPSKSAGVVWLCELDVDDG